MLTVPVAEIFGPTIQGEGAIVGQPTYFLRVGGCDYSCVWCDSGHAVNPEEVRGLPRLTPHAISDRLISYRKLSPGPQWLTISGGNPALYDLSEVVYAWQTFTQDGHYGAVAVETQGTRWQSWLGEVDLLTVSPKAPSSGLPREKSFGALNKFVDLYTGGARSVRWQESSDRPYFNLEQQIVLKVVVFDEEDYDFALTLHRNRPFFKLYLSCGTAMGGLSGKWVPPPVEGEKGSFSSVRLHPDVNWTQGTLSDTTDSLLARYRWLVEKMMKDPEMADVSVLPQLHALIWGIDTKGV